MLEDLLLYTGIPCFMSIVASDMSHQHKTAGTNSAVHHCEPFLLLSFLLRFTTSTAMPVQGVIQVFINEGHRQVYVGPS